ncbi:UNKNOWN [Stylonychia lemnae]|uniref:Uncharacterized protein n=1 Tax=Stylonychia lemnae TaxID=5949 RepID=A0A078B1D9_STYLE|nr:UNKNOWN [Stylonychia lemnae]|eukprot:CDW88136.1 UNKNOWN [Stylonychia lemnae]
MMDTLKKINLFSNFKTLNASKPPLASAFLKPSSINQSRDQSRQILSVSQMSSEKNFPQPGSDSSPLSQPALSFIGAQKDDSLKTRTELLLKDVLKKEKKNQVTNIDIRIKSMKQHILQRLNISPTTKIKSIPEKYNRQYERLLDRENRFKEFDDIMNSEKRIKLEIEKELGDLKVKQIADFYNLLEKIKHRICQVSKWGRIRGIILSSVRLMTYVKEIRAIRMKFKIELQTILSKLIQIYSEVMRTWMINHMKAFIMHLVENKELNLNYTEGGITPKEIQY